MAEERRELKRSGQSALSQSRTSAIDQIKRAELDSGDGIFLTDRLQAISAQA